MPKVFKLKRSPYYYYRLSVNGRDRWISTKKTRKEEAEEVAADAHAVERGKLTLAEQFSALLRGILALPPAEQKRVRQEFARQLIAGSTARMETDKAWQAWRDSPLKGNPSEVTLKSYEGIWKQFKQWTTKRRLTHMHQVSPAVAQEYAGHIWGKGITARTFNAHMMLLKNVFRTLRVPAGLMDDPWSDIKPLEKQTQGRENFTTEELAKICAKATGSMRGIIGLALYTGLRMGDCCLLRWGNVQDGKIVVVPLKTRRKGKKIVLPIHPILDLLLKERQHGTDDDYVFPDLAAEYLREPSTFSKRFQEFLVSCGIVTTGAKGERRKRAVVLKGFHSLRHSFVSLCAANNVPQHAIQALVGHGSPAMTELYTHVDAAQRQAAIAALPALGFDKQEKAT